MVAEQAWTSASKPELWRAALDRLPKEQRDVYFEPAYVALHENGKSLAECFLYGDGGETFLYPFVRQEVPFRPGYFDICSAYGYSGPLATTTDGAFLRAAFAAFQVEAKSRRVVAEVVKCHPLLANHRLLEAGGFPGKLIPVCQTAYVEINVDDEQRWSQIYSHANRKNINKCRRANAQFVVGPDERQWQAFDELYVKTMDANNAAGFYYFTPEYFQKIRTTLPERHLLVSVTVEDKIGAVMLVLLGETMAHCHLVGTERELKGLGVNNFLHHELIQWCKAKGYASLHIGGGRSNAEDDSLLNFKKNFTDKTATYYVGENILDLAIYEELCAEWTSLNPGKEISGRLLKYRY